jgi:peptidoglycan/LPS O-acetylase OafA/YrhL
VTSTQPTVQHGPAVGGAFQDEPADEPSRPLTHRTNNFDFLRLLGALAVVLGHAYHLLGAGQFAPGMLGQPVQALGVIIFFSISGYLITASWTRSRDVVAYTAARVLRIFPALVVVVVISAYVLGPLVTVLPTGAYLGDPTTADYLRNILMQPVYFLPGVFADLPYPNAVNGSLWTLPAELFCYVVVPLALLVPRLARPVVVLALLLASMWYAGTASPESAIFYGTRVVDAASMWVFFAAGSLLRLGHERFKGLFRTDVAVGLMAVYVAVLGIQPLWALKWAWLVLPYVVLTIGLASTPVLRRSARFGDLSYGIYLWAFPVQQTLVHVVGVLNMTVNLVLVGGISALLALASWHLVEKPSLRLKDRVPRRLRRAS